MTFSIVKLGDVVEIKGGKRLPKDHELTTTPTKHPYIRARDIGDGKVELSDPVYISEETYQIIKRYTVKRDDVVITIVGANIGDVGYITEESHGANLTENAVKLYPKNYEVLWPKFLKYSLISPDQKHKMQMIAAGAAQGKLGLYKINEFPILLPTLQTQQKIASILSAYDDLIENNLKRIKLLEEAARNIYKEWFVHFRFPGYEDAEFENGLPKGWQFKQSGDVAILHYGKALKADERVSGKYPVYGSSGIVGFHNSFLVNAPAIVVGRKGNVGSIFWAYENFFPIDTVYYVESQSSLYLLYFNLKGRSYVNSDSAVPGLNRAYAYQLDVLLPTKPILQEFDTIVDKLFLQINNLGKQNEKLKEARDILLPRLMNRTIEVE